MKAKSKVSGACVVIATLAGCVLPGNLEEYRGGVLTIVAEPGTTREVAMYLGQSDPEACQAIDDGVRATIDGVELALVDGGGVQATRPSRGELPCEAALFTTELQLDEEVLAVAADETAKVEARFALPDSDLILPVPRETLLSVRRLGLKLRSFTLPIPLPTIVLSQAWHPRFDNDPAHRWLRETLKTCCDETWLAAQPVVS